MGSNECCFNDPSPKKLPMKYTKYQHVSLTASILKFIIKRRWCLWTSMKKNKRQFMRQEKEQPQSDKWILASSRLKYTNPVTSDKWILQPLKCTNQATLREWILSSPTNIKLNKIKSYVSTTDNNGSDYNGITLTKFSSMVNVNHSGEEDFEGLKSECRDGSSVDILMKDIEEGERGEVKDISLLRKNQSGKKMKKVSFRLPKLGDIFLLDSTDACFESY